MTGHMMGAAGAAEAIFCVKVIETGKIPATMNYVSADPLCDLDYVPNQTRDASVKHAVSNAFGFGGHNVSLAVGAVE